jgi:hypothetical protein
VRCRSGRHERGPFGRHRLDRLGVFMQKKLAPA